MNRRARNKIILALTCIALFSALISPACAFMNGKGDWVQICRADGLVVAVPLAQVSKAQTGQEGQPQGTHKTQLECGFCFAHDQLKTTTITQSHLAATPHPQALIISSGTIRFQSAIRHHYQSRAPPLLFV